MNYRMIKRAMNSLSRSASLATMAVAVSSAVDAATLPEWTQQIRPDHPRLFFNAQSWPRVRERALDAERDWYQRIKGQADRRLTTLEQPASAAARDLGVEAAQAAFVFLVTEDSQYLAQAKQCLATSLDCYEASYRQRTAVNWYSTSRVHAILAWDWLYNQLTEAERREYLSRLVQVIDLVLRAKPPIYRENLSGYNTGFYGVQNCLWFLGCTGFKTGIESDKINEWLVWGRTENLKLLEHRRQACGDDGGGASATLGYVLGAYPWAEQNFFYTWLSSVGENLAPDWPHSAWLANYVLWQWIAAEPGPLEFGYGDTPHTSNRLPIQQLDTHLANIRHLYGEKAPQAAALARHVQGLLPTQGYSSTWFIYPFLWTELEKSSERFVPETLPKARHFENMGQMVMRSGAGKEDTYCLFSCGGTLAQHRHYDALSFVLYHRGFLALDSGTRYDEFTNGEHLANYFAQTVAHNCVVIHQPGEPPARYWGGTVLGNHGGQHRATGSVVRAFETHDDYVYVAGDATACYQHGASRNPTGAGLGEECSQTTRQLVFLLPNHFLAAMSPVTRVERNGRIGVRVEIGPDTWQVMFNPTGSLGGRITRIGQQQNLDAPLTDRVQRQVGILAQAYSGMTHGEAKTRIPQRKLPEFWIGDVNGLANRFKQLKTAEVKVIARSPGGRPLHLVAFGEPEHLPSRANFNSAMGAQEPSAYRDKSARKKPVLLFLGPVHGHEVEGLTGLVNLIQIMETGRDLRGRNQSELQGLGRKCRLLIIPEGNPDGTARFEPRSLHGLSEDDLRFWGQGTWSDGTFCGWPESKRQHPMVGDNVGFLGCYFNDQGVNPMHDEFFAPMSTEAPAILKVAKEAAPDLAVSLHSHESKPALLRPAYVPLELQEATRELAQQCYALMDQRGLPHAQPFTAQPESGRYPAAFNLGSAVYHISGANSFTFECPHGLTNASACHVSLEQILDIQLTLYEAMIRSALALIASLNAERLHAQDADGFIPLFNGKNLDGWQGATDVYAVEDGKLVCQKHGSIYMLAPAKRGHLKPAGQWNSEEIMFHGRRAKITLNGVVIVEVDLDNLEYKKYLDRNTGRARAKGHLGFLGHGSRVEFRNIRIKEL